MSSPFPLKKFHNHSEKVLEKSLRVDGELPTNLSNELQGVNLCFARNVEHCPSLTQVGTYRARITNAGTTALQMLLSKARMERMLTFPKPYQKQRRKTVSTTSSRIQIKSMAF